jgi:ABC-2 type transport system permease protein
MITDIFTVMWKEFKELLFRRGNLRGGWVGMLFFVAVFGIYMPLQSGTAWVQSPIGLVVWAWVPFLLVSSVIADSFAGERERHTLETLLASRLSDRAILFGKLGAAVGYGWGFSMANILIGLVAVNLVYGQGRLLLFPADIALGVVLVSFLVAAFASGIGVLISLRAATVRQAQQTFSLVNLLIFVPIFLLPILPDDWKLRISQVLLQINLTQVAIAFVAVLALVDIALVVIAIARFQRSRLILD